MGLGKSTEMKFREEVYLQRTIQRRSSEHGIVELPYSHGGHPKDLGRVAFNN